MGKLIKQNYPLYPPELYQLHKDLDDMAYGNLADKEREDLLARIPKSLDEAESTADAMLIAHLQRATNDIGIERYGEIVFENAGHDARIMYAIRCFIASAGIVAEPDVIEIYAHKPLSNVQFHKPEDVSAMADGSLLIDETANEDPYARALARVDDVSDRQLIARKVSQVRTSLRDVLPKEYLPRAQAVLDAYGLEITKENAWMVMTTVSQKASIHDRIVSRLLYLMTNAALVDRPSSDRKQLPL